MTVTNSCIYAVPNCLLCNAVPTITGYVKENIEEMKKKANEKHSKQ